MRALSAVAELLVLLLGLLRDVIDFIHVQPVMDALNGRCENV